MACHHQFSATRYSGRGRAIDCLRPRHDTSAQVRPFPTCGCPSRRQFGGKRVFYNSHEKIQPLLAKRYKQARGQENACDPDTATVNENKRLSDRPPAPIPGRPVERGCAAAAPDRNAERNHDQAQPAKRLHLVAFVGQLAVEEDGAGRPAPQAPTCRWASSVLPRTPSLQSPLHLGGSGAL